MAPVLKKRVRLAKRRVSRAAFDEFRALYSKKKTITARWLVRWAATHPGGALHRMFEWDDAKAGPKYRLEQARWFIRNFQLEVVPGRIYEVRGYVSLLSDRTLGGGLFRRLDVVMEDKEKRAELLAMARGELDAVRQKYSDLVELSHVWRVIDAECFE